MKSITIALLFFMLSFPPYGYCEKNKSLAEMEKQILAMPDKEVHALFTQAVVKQKRLLPKQVNSFIFWVDIAIENKQVFNVYFVDKERVNFPFALALTELKEKGKTRALKRAVSTPSVALMVKRGYKIIYLYFDKDKNLLHRFVIDQGDFV